MVSVFNIMFYHFMLIKIYVIENYINKMKKDKNNQNPKISFLKFKKYLPCSSNNKRNLMYIINIYFYSDLFLQKNERLKLVLSTNYLLNLCSSALNSQRLLCSQKGWCEMFVYSGIQKALYHIFMINLFYLSNNSH